MGHNGLSTFINDSLKPGVKPELTSPEVVEIKLLFFKSCVAALASPRDYPTFFP